MAAATESIPPFGEWGPGERNYSATFSDLVTKKKQQEGAAVSPRLPPLQSPRPSPTPSPPGSPCTPSVPYYIPCSPRGSPSTPSVPYYVPCSPRAYWAPEGSAWTPEPSPRRNGGPCADKGFEKSTTRTVRAHPDPGAACATTEGPGTHAYYGTARRIGPHQQRNYMQAFAGYAWDALGACTPPRSLFGQLQEEPAPPRASSRGQKGCGTRPMAGWATEAAFTSEDESLHAIFDRAARMQNAPSMPSTEPPVNIALAGEQEFMLSFEAWARNGDRCRQHEKGAPSLPGSPMSAWAALKTELKARPESEMQGPQGPPSGPDTPAQPQPHASRKAQREQTPTSTARARWKGFGWSASRFRDGSLDGTSNTSKTRSWPVRFLAW